MSLKLDSRVTAEMIWGWTEHTGNVSATSSGNWKRQIVFSSETAPAVNTAWCAQGTILAAEGTQTWNLTALTRETLELSTVISLGSIGAVYVYNRSGAAPILVENTGSTTAENTADGSFLRVVIPAGGAVCLGTPLADWSITTARNQLTVTNLSDTASATVDIAVLGVLVEDEEEEA